ncbi:hypothetical protein B0T10DRAFT_465780 [Thelonectria olida]|uniref:Uncharacterized protein n=1 Tax=Thelonectria olida TaxID=1576542 RepID=A0A9P8VRS2_9HYPO|nr:hypothetical protein B0T10DRAFT_465780 [Thelonectria olida]
MPKRSYNPITVSETRPSKRLKRTTHLNAGRTPGKVPRVHISTPSPCSWECFDYYCGTLMQSTGQCAGHLPCQEGQHKTVIFSDDIAVIPGLSVSAPSYYSNEPANADILASSAGIDRGIYDSINPLILPDLPSPQIAMTERAQGLHSEFDLEYDMNTAMGLCWQALPLEPILAITHGKQMCCLQDQSACEMLASSPNYHDQSMMLHSQRKHNQFNDLALGKPWESSNQLDQAVTELARLGSQLQEENRRQIDDVANSFTAIVMCS